MTKSFFLKHTFDTDDSRANVYMYIILNLRKLSEESIAIQIKEGNGDG